MEKYVPHIATKVNVVKPFIIRTEFANGKVTEFDVRSLFGEFPIFKQLSDEKLFSEMNLDPLGVSIVWNDEIDLSTDEPYFAGKVVGHIDPNYPILIGTKINVTRLALGYSQRELSKKSGVIQADICRIELGKANPTMMTLEKIAKALKISLKELFED